jgi:hypothetical protein
MPLGRPVLSNFEIGLDFIENEVALVDRLQVGSEEAFETLMHLYGSCLQASPSGPGGSSEAADAVQEILEDL